MVAGFVSAMTGRDGCEADHSSLGLEVLAAHTDHTVHFGDMVLAGLDFAIADCSGTAEAVLLDLERLLDTPVEDILEPHGIRFEVEGILERLENLEVVGNFG